MGGVCCGLASNSSFKWDDAKTKWYDGFVSELPALDGKVIAITGCTSGTGLACAKAVALKGATVIMLNRKSPRAEAAEAAVKAAAPSATVETIECDLMSFESVKSAATAVLDKYQTLDVLCNNAGVMALKDEATKDGYDVQMQTNHLSHFLLTHLLYPLLEAAAEANGEARIVNHSSGARMGAGGKLKEANLGQNGGNLGGNGSSMLFGARWMRYAQTKFANAVFTQALAKRLAEKGSKVKALGCEPGLATTDLQRTTNKAGGMPSSWPLNKFAQSAEDGSMPLLQCCVGENVASGTFWKPKGVTGPPKTEPITSKEKGAKNTSLLWQASEAAVGAWDL